MTSARYLALGVVLGLGLTLSWSQPVSASPEILSHKALYTVKLGESRDGSQFTGAEGAMSLQLEQTCDGWILGQQMRMRIDTVVDGNINQDLRFTGWESTGFDQYRFVSRNFLNNIEEKARGRASLADLSVSFSEPEENKISLPADTLFPIAHTVWLIEQAKAENRFVKAKVFDGTDGGPPNKVTAFIAKAVEPEKHREGKKDLGEAVDVTGWPMRLAFYPMDGRAAEPDYEVELFQLENGATSSMLLDYQDFSLKLTLEEIEVLPKPVCQ